MYQQPETAFEAKPLHETLGYVSGKKGVKIQSRPRSSVDRVTASYCAADGVVECKCLALRRVNVDGSGSAQKSLGTDGKPLRAAVG